MCPGSGANCKTVYGPRLKLRAVIHFHCNGAGVVMAYEGHYKDCWDYKNRKKEEDEVEQHGH